ncbi:glycosyltransferase family A protein [Akkermansia sp. N21169]|uniref:glycosyltransferase family A protein n=1 Tax=Akkermansia sp. N21169 TaxID=3040765 RepID=UPI00244EBF8A|nr:glycosyltransferase family A protein [Akkermansia sp. N21169]MDH3067603.1 glycosyltransferase family A protein [Akkermansia sp. N21169]
MKHNPIHKKIAVCLPSYKRLESLERQIFSFMHQTYASEDYHVFVAVKGVTEYVFNKMLVPRFRHFIETGRLTLRYFPNKNQMSNIIDTVRDLDISGYDLFVKIDDDDFYSPDYLENINDFHSTLPPCYSSYYNARDLIARNLNGFFCLKNAFYRFFGFALNMSPQVLEKVMECELNPSLMIPIVEKWQHKTGHTNFGFNEDNFIFMLMREYGCANMADYVKEQGILPHIVVQKGNPSVTRGGMIEKRFLIANASIATDPASWEHLLELSHPHWRDSFRIQGKRGRRLDGGSLASVLERTPERLILCWDDWGVEVFEADENAMYVLAGKITAPEG